NIGGGKLIRHCSASVIETCSKRLAYVIGRLCLIWQPDAKPGAFAGRRVKPQLSAMTNDDPLAQRQTKARALGACGKENVKDARTVSLWDSRSGILDPPFHATARRLRTDLDDAWPSDSFHAVAQ